MKCTRLTNTTAAKPLTNAALAAAPDAFAAIRTGPANVLDRKTALSMAKK
jgi:hypothetical protein